MSTHAIIAEITNNTVRSIYLHNDGYIEHTGYILENFYNTPKAVDDLIKLGDLSVLAPNMVPNPAYPHSFDHPQPNTTIAYHRDRDEDLHITTFPMLDTEEALIGRLSEGSFVYVFKNKKWYWAADGHKRLKRLSTKLKSMKGSIIHDNTPVQLNADQINQIDNVINNLINQMTLFKDYMQGSIDKTTVNTHLTSLEQDLQNLSDLTGHTNINDEIRSKDLRIRELESQINKVIEGNAVEHTLRHYEHIARCWHEAFGFDFASIEIEPSGLTLIVSSELTRGNDDLYLADDDFYIACTKHLTPLRDLDGISIDNDRLLYTDKNKRLLFENLEEQFPNSCIYKYASRLYHGQCLLEPKMLLTYQDLAAFEKRMLADE